LTAELRKSRTVPIDFRVDRSAQNSLKQAFPNSQHAQNQTQDRSLPLVRQPQPNLPAGETFGSIIMNAKPAVRKKSVQACRSCRIGKRKCDSARPTCEACARRAIPGLCIYDRPGESRAQTARCVEPDIHSHHPPLYGGHILTEPTDILMLSRGELLNLKRHRVARAQPARAGHLRPPWIISSLRIWAHPPLAPSTRPSKQLHTNLLTWPASAFLTMLQ
jgi:hypothetical protein